MTGSLEIASVREAAGEESAEQMVEVIVNDFSLIIGELKLGMEYAESIQDETTGDLLLGIHSALEKHVWMLNSFLGK